MVLDSRRCQNVVKTLVPSVHLVCADACAETWNLSVKSSKIMIENMKCFITSCCSRLWQVWVPQGHPHHPLCWCCRNHTPCTSSREHEILLCFSIGKKKVSWHSHTLNISLQPLRSDVYSLSAVWCSHKLQHLLVDVF